MKHYYPMITLLIISIMLFAGCSKDVSQNNENKDMQKSEDITLSKLCSPFRENGNKSDWYLTQNFGAYLENYQGSHPAEDWNRASGNSDAGENVYPIAPGRVKKAGSVGNGLGKYIVIEHSGKFMIPASNGPHLKALQAPDHTDGKGYFGDGKPMIDANYVFGDGTLTDYLFSKENPYSYSGEVADTIYSVYLHIDTALKEGDEIKQTDMDKPLGKLASTTMVPSHLHFEIRHPEAAKRPDGFNCILGGKGNGYFSDSQKMVDLGYREPSSIIQANRGQAISGGDVLGATNGGLKIPVTNIQIGQYVQFGRYLGESILWQVVIKDNGIMLVSDRILCVKPFDAAESGNTIHEGNIYTSVEEARQKGGSNKWSNSNIREWLNSSSQKVSYTTYPPTKSAVWQGYNAYEDEPGFLFNFTQIERDAIQSIAHDGVTDLVYLLSEEELQMLSVKTRMTTENAVKNNNYPRLVKVQNWCYMLRTPSSGSNYILNVTSEGDAGWYSPGQGDKGVLPVLNLKTDIYISKGEGTSNMPYIIEE